MTGTQPASTGTQSARTGASPSGLMTEAEFRGIYERLRSHLPWGPDDRRGALNYLTPDEVRSAAGEVKLGRAVSLEGLVETRPPTPTSTPCAT